MKRFLLSLLIIPLLLIGGFSSAYDYTLLQSLTFNTPSPNSQYFSSDIFCEYLSNWNRIPKFNEICVKVSPVWTLTNVWLVIHNARYNVTNYTSMTCIPVSYSCYWTDTRIQTYWRDFDWTVVSLYEKVPSIPISNSSISPVIDWISDVTTEFIPYVVYIWIWTLLVTLWFIAVKWLVNWLVRKITVIFKSKRG